MTTDFWFWFRVFCSDVGAMCFIILIFLALERIKK